MFRDMSGFQEGKHGSYTAAASPCDRPAAELRMYPSEGELIHAKRRDCRLRLRLNYATVLLYLSVSQPWIPESECKSVWFFFKQLL